jgi:hypothetical protein
MPLSDVDVRIVHAEDGDRLMPAGEVGDDPARTPEHVEY